MTTDAKVQIGLSNEFLEGTSVNTGAGNGLFREGVVVSDPEAPDARARVLSSTPTGTEHGMAVRQVGAVALDSATLAALETVNVQNTVNTTDSTDSEYSRVATSVTAAGDTTLVTPAAGKRIRLQWVYAINDPVASTSTKITIKLGASVQYVAWAISKRQQLTGPVNGALVVNLSAVGDVAVTVFYQEVD